MPWRILQLSTLLPEHPRPSSKPHARSLFLLELGDRWRNYDGGSFFLIGHPSHNVALDEGYPSHNLLILPGSDPTGRKTATILLMPSGP
jgi:hypothetical protein